MQNMRDEELMLDYQKGDMRAMDELLRRYKNPVYHFAFRLSQNTAEAQDIAQDVFLNVHKSRANYRPMAKFRTWLFSIAHNLYISRLRKRKWEVLWPRKQDDPDELVELESPNPTPKDEAITNETTSVLKKCIQGLPSLQKEALILREYQGLEYIEIGKILNKPQGTIKTLIHRARENLKNKLLPYADEIKGGP